VDLGIAFLHCAVDDVGVLGLARGRPGPQHSSRGLPPSFRTFRGWGGPGRRLPALRKGDVHAHRKCETPAASATCVARTVSAGSAKPPFRGRQQVAQAQVDVGRTAATWPASCAFRASSTADRTSGATATCTGNPIPVGLLASADGPASPGGYLPPRRRLDRLPPCKVMESHRPVGIGTRSGRQTLRPLCRNSAETQPEPRDNPRDNHVTVAALRWKVLEHGTRESVAN